MKTMIKDSEVGTWVRSNIDGLYYVFSEDRETVKILEEKENGFLALFPKHKHKVLIRYDLKTSEDDLHKIEKIITDQKIGLVLWIALEIDMALMTKAREMCRHYDSILMVFKANIERNKGELPFELNVIH